MGLAKIKTFFTLSQTFIDSNLFEIWGCGMMGPSEIFFNSCKKKGEEEVLFGSNSYTERVALQWWVVAE